jgi:NAD+ diphosphatase
MYIISNKFSKSIKKRKNKSRDSLWFIFKGDNLLLKKNSTGGDAIPSAKNFNGLKLACEDLIYLGKYEEKDCYAGELEEKSKLKNNIIACKLRKSYNLIGGEFFQVAGYAFQIINWHKNSIYCGRCGSKVKDMKEEQAKICPKCNLINYPVICPAVIVAVIKDDKILLASAKRFAKNLYSVLAGFVEVGENLEKCVLRELKEEVGIEVKNIKYFGSQPWPFPNSLMVAFTAEYSKGEISTDKKEILDAGWFKSNELPLIPEKPSIAKDLIDWFIANNS